MMQVSLNGSEHSLPDGASVRDAIDSLEGGDPTGVAVAVDGTVVPRSQWDQFLLSSNQKIEVVRAVQGG